MPLHDESTRETSSLRSAIPISPPYWCKATSSYDMHVGFRGREYAIRWSTPDWYPDTSTFPPDGTMAEEIVHNTQEELIWNESRICGFGSYAHVRQALSDDPFPMYKISHRTPIARQQIANEFTIITSLGDDLPVVKVDRVALKDDRGIFAFRMARLFDMDHSEITSRLSEIKSALGYLHSHQVIHGDLTPSNIMKDNHGRICFVDFGHAGFLGAPLPPYHPARIRKVAETFVYGIDLLFLQRIEAS